jgi:UDP-GlcNAc:undecaprenyl-phosphate GlcNAc-1-phosphate transferase
LNKIFSIIKSSCLYIGLIDKPNLIKNHKNSVPLSGGLLLILTFSLCQFFFNYENYINFYLIFFISLLGIIDDICDLNANIKFIVSFAIIFLIISNHKDLQIKFVYFEYFNSLFFPKNIFFNIFFPTLCLMLLLNAFNMTDGINLLASLIFLSWLLYLFIKFPLNLEIFTPIISILFFFLYFNFLGKTFLGDGGNYFLSMLIGSLIIKLNNEYPKIISSEEIFLVLMIPGIDMLRLFVERIKNKKSPFRGDRKHLHHYLSKKFGNKVTLAIYLSLINVPIYFVTFFKINIILLIIFTIIIYCFLIKVCVLKKI